MSEPYVDFDTLLSWVRTQGLHCQDGKNQTHMSLMFGEVERRLSKLDDADAAGFETSAELERARCVWTEEFEPDETSWNTACGEKWVFIADGPAENRVKFCQGCGKPVELRHAESE